MPERKGQAAIRRLHARGASFRRTHAPRFDVENENVPDIRNSKVHDTITYLQGFGITVLGCDPILEAPTVKKYFGIENVALESVKAVDAVLVANKHDVFRSITLDQLKAKMKPPVLIDIKNLFDRNTATAAGFYYKSL